MRLLSLGLSSEGVKAGGMDALKNYRPFPKVQCPGCAIPMKLMDLQPIMFITSQLSRATYRCEHCGTETKREFKDGGGVKQPARHTAGLAKKPAVVAPRFRSGDG